MALKGCYACIKYLVIIFNFLFWLAGIAVLALSIYSYIKGNEYASGSQEAKAFFVSLYILMAAGSLMTILGFLGCCGALRESQCMLGTFFFLVLVILVAEIVAGVWAIMNKSDVEETITNELKKMIQEQYGYDEVINKTIDAIQHDFKCCGAKGPEDWAQSKFFKGITNSALAIGSSNRVPHSCCKTELCSTAGVAINSEITSYSEGCVKKVEQFLTKHLTIVAGIGIGLGVIQLLGLIFSIVLCCAIRNGEGTSYHV